MNEGDLRKTLIEEIRHLAFGGANDAVKLAFLPEDGLDCLDGLDLTALRSLRRLSNGTVELELIDRIKLIELLLSAGQGGENGGAGNLIRALDRAAERLGETGDSGGLS